MFNFIRGFRHFGRDLRYLGPGNFVRYFFFQRVMGINGRISWPVHWSSAIRVAKNIHLEDETVPPYPGYSIGNYIQANNGIYFGSHTLIGPGVKIISANHDLENFSKHIPAKPVRIGRHCWLSANCVILPEVELGDNTIVGAGAVVTKSFPEGNCVLAGVPAKVIRRLTPAEQPGKETAGPAQGGE